VNLDFHVGIARVLGLLVGRDGVDVFGVGRVGQVDPVFAGLADQLLDQVVSAFGAFLVMTLSSASVHSLVSCGSMSAGSGKALGWLAMVCLRG
jgi:hypothetical protein